MQFDWWFLRLRTTVVSRIDSLTKNWFLRFVLIGCTTPPFRILWWWLLPVIIVLSHVKSTIFIILLPGSKRCLLFISVLSKYVTRTFEHITLRLFVVFFPPWVHIILFKSWWFRVLFVKPSTNDEVALASRRSMDLDWGLFFPLMFWRGLMHRYRGLHMVFVI